MRPQQLEGDRILLYAASEHGVSPSAHMSLSLKDGQLVYTQQHEQGGLFEIGYCFGLERQEIKSANILPQDAATGVDILIMRNRYGVSLVVNGRNNSEKV